MENPVHKLTLPKKKKIRFQEKDSPLPVPISSITGIKPSNEKWCYYTGRLVDGHVQVSHTGDMEFLYKMV